MSATINVLVGPLHLPGALRIPPDCDAFVVFAHGSGSSRQSPRNIHAAARLGERRMGTLLFDLLTDFEAQDRRNVFDINLLGRRMVEAIDWLSTRPESTDKPLGLFGASTGAAAALVAAAQRPRHVRAVVSRGGRPDLAGEVLALVEAPTLLIVGGADVDVLALNRRAMQQMRCPHKLTIIPHAGHLFEEPGTLDAALDAAADWFEGYLETRNGGSRI